MIANPMAQVVLGVRIENARSIERRWQQATTDKERRQLRREYFSEIYDCADIARSLEIEGGR